MKKRHKKRYKQFEELIEDIEAGKIKTLPNAIRGMIVDIYVSGGMGFQAPYRSKRLFSDNIILDEIANAIGDGFLYETGDKRYMIGFDSTTPEPTITVWDYDKFEYVEDAKIKWFDLAVDYVKNNCDSYYIETYVYDDKSADAKNRAIYHAIDWDGYAPVSQIRQI